MARKTQKLINYHTGKKTEMPSGSSVDFGEIVVRHNAETPELLIKIGTDSFGVFQASGAVQTAINTAKKDVYDSATTFATNAVSTAQSTLNTKISDLQSDVNSLSSATKTLIDEVSGATKATYATKAELEATSGSIITAYTTAISDVRSDLNALSGVVKSISTDIGNNYVTTGKLETTVTTLEGKISAAQKAATDASSAYTDSKIETSETYTKGLIDGVASDLKDLKTTVETDYVLTTTLTTKVTELEGNISTAKDDAISSGKTYTDAQIADVKSDVTTLSANVESTINAKITNVYRYKGSCAYAALPTTGNVTGDVWNVTDANDNFPAGTNYAWDGEKWDALGGSIDLSPYAKTEDVNKSIETVNQSITKLDSKVGAFSSATVAEFTSLKNYAGDTYATKEELKSASGSIISDYTTAIGNAKDKVYSSATTAAAASAETLNNSIEAVDGRVTELSASTVNIETTANSAIQNASIVDGDSCKVSVSKDNTVLKFDFSNLVIDCGDF